MYTVHECCDGGGVVDAKLSRPTRLDESYGAAASHPAVVWEADEGLGRLAAPQPGSSWVLARRGRGARAGIMQLRPWAANDNVGVGGDMTEPAATASADCRSTRPGPVGRSSVGWGWGLGDDVAGVFDILMDLDLFLNDQVATAVRTESDRGGLAWLDAGREGEEKGEAEEQEEKKEAEEEQEKESKEEQEKKGKEEQQEEVRLEKKQQEEQKEKEQEERLQKSEKQGEEEKQKEKGQEILKKRGKQEQEDEKEQKGKEKEERVEKIEEEQEESKEASKDQEEEREEKEDQERGVMELASSPADAAVHGSALALEAGTRLFVTGACLECVHVAVESALSSAVRNGHAACLQCLLNNLAGAEAEETEAGLCDRLARRFPLLDAVERGHDEVLRLGLGFLRDCGRLPEALLVADGQGRRPVHLAAYRDHPSCLELLLACTPTEARFWLDGRAQWTPLQHAAAGGAVRCLRRLLKVEDAQVTTSSGRTSVSLAAQAGSVGCLEELIDGASANARLPDEDGMTPVHYAAQAGHLNCAHWLVRRARCSLNESRKKDGATAMHLAAGKGRCPILQWALNRELSTAAELDVFGRTPVHYAAEEGQITALRTLSKFQQVNLDATDFLGRTPSNLAERRGHSACVRFLDSCLQQRHPDGEGALLAKLTRSISSPGGLNNKLNRRNSNRRSGRRKHISSVYLEEKTPMPGVERSATLRERPVSREGAGHILSALISQVGMMSAAPVLPALPLHRRIINSLFRKFKEQTEVEDFTVTL